MPRDLQKEDENKEFKRRDRNIETTEPETEFVEEVVEVRRVAKVVKGGKNLSFRAIVVVGNKNGKVGLGVASGREVVDAIRKASNLAKRTMVDVNVINDTIPHTVEVKFDSARLLLKPAAPGTGIIASNTARPALELAGIKNVLCKSLGSNTPLSILRAVFKAFDEIKPPEYYAKLRGISLRQLFHGEEVVKS
jgi:small subunit ribosomal protein S5